MPKYVALLRGIGPLNPNMRNDKLRQVFESLGFTNIRTVISSGNVLFESKSRDIPKLETMIEHELPAQLCFHSTTIIRSHQQLLDLDRHHPFGNMQHANTNYLTVTFLRRRWITRQARTIQMTSLIAFSPFTTMRFSAS